ncbi:Complement C3 [Varanus komodoensis]|nr:Complement C3 [Varanus komodoensis]
MQKVSVQVQVGGLGSPGQPCPTNWPSSCSKEDLWGRRSWSSSNSSAKMILEKSIKMASNYINQYYESLKHPYTVALASYALALAGVLNSEEVLMRASTDRNRWEDNDGSIATEGTSYALLTLMKLKKFEDAGHVAEWLIGRNHYGATYGHTQSTIMVFQALAQYKIDLPSSRDQIMDVSFLLPQRSAPVTFRIDQKNSLLARTTETKLNEQFTVQARGQGEATVTVLTMYYAQLKEKKVVCNNFDLKVSVKEIELSEKQTKGALGAIEMKICARYLGEIDAAMTMIDVSMLTGFIPDTEELKRLSEGVDKYITQFEIDNIKSEKGNLLLYLYKVSHTQDECLQFKAYKHFEVGFLQPGSVKIYSYYALDEQCTKFYHLSKDSAVFSKLCQGAVCQCANENCYKRYEADDPVNVQKRINEACKPGVDYVYKTRLNRTEEANGFIVYLMEALEVIKRGKKRQSQKKKAFSSNKALHYTVVALLSSPLLSAVPTGVKCSREGWAIEQAPMLPAPETTATTGGELAGHGTQGSQLGAAAKRRSTEQLVSSLFLRGIHSSRRKEWRTWVPPGCSILGISPPNPGQPFPTSAGEEAPLAGAGKRETP